MPLIIYGIVHNEKTASGIVGTPTELYDDNRNRLIIGDIVKVTHKTTKWSRLSFVCYRDDAYIPYLPHIRKSDTENFYCEKVIDYCRITDGFRLGDYYVTELKQDNKQSNNMTLDEAIQHCREKEDCTECGQEHKQLREWLEELKRLRQKQRCNTEYIDYREQSCGNCKYGYMANCKHRHFSNSHGINMGCFNWTPARCNT